MALLKVYDLNKTEVGEITVADEVFGADVNQNLFYEVVKMQQANKRAGTHATKTRGMINGSTAKLFRQKGTGNARKGSVKSPLLHGGGTVFGPHPRDYSYKVPRSVRRGAMISALSLRAKEAKLLVLQDFAMSEIKTKNLLGILEKLGVNRPLIIDDGNDTLLLSARNLKGVDVLPAIGLNVYDILRHDELVMTRAAVEKVEERLKK
jgi:large subunit ribosomal protein L4